MIIKILQSAFKNKLIFIGEEERDDLKIYFEFHINFTMFVLFYPNLYFYLYLRQLFEREKSRVSDLSYFM